MGQNPFDDLNVVLAPANSIRGALFRLRDVVDEIGGHDISYEYMLRKTSYVRADLINMTTLPSAHTDMYLPAGGTNSDPVIENAGEMGEPMFVDLRDICNKKGTKYYKNQFFLKLVQDGCPYLSAFPFNDSVARGYGVFTIFDSRPREDVEPFSSKLTALGYDLHKAIIDLSLYQSYFKLGDKELRTLERMAVGQTTEDIAIEDNVSRRTIELRLETARKKLKAKNSIEAVYKAISYEIINPE